MVFQNISFLKKQCVWEIISSAENVNNSCCVGHGFEGRRGQSSQKLDIHQVLSPGYEHTRTGSPCLLLCVSARFEANAQSLKATVCYIPNNDFFQFLSQWL